MISISTLAIIILSVAALWMYAIGVAFLWMTAKGDHGGPSGATEWLAVIAWPIVVPIFFILQPQ